MISNLERDANTMKMTQEEYRIYFVCEIFEKGLSP